MAMMSEIRGVVFRVFSGATVHVISYSQRLSKMVGHTFRVYPRGNANSERQGDLPGLLTL